MKKLYAASLCLAAVACMLVGFPKQATTNPTTPQAGKTGAPSEGTCANSGCHTGSTGTGNVSIAYSGGGTYKADSTYTITVTVTDATAVKFGFELTALDASNAKAGNITLTDLTHTSLPTSGGAVAGRQYVGHKNASSFNGWSFQWTAPSSDVGNVTFYYAGNGANGNGHDTGDHIYTGSATVYFEAVINGIKNIDGLSSFAVQNPAMHSLNLTYALAHDANMQMDLFDATGKFVTNLEQGMAASGEHNVNRSLSNVTPGLYLIRVNLNGNVQSQKLLVL